MSDTINPKFGVPPGDPPFPTQPFPPQPFSYGNVYEVQRGATWERLALAPASDHVGLLRDLADALNGPYGILYVLGLSRRGDAQPGRYQSPEPVEKVLLHSFLEEYRAFLEGDGRHAIWVFALGDRATLVYDRHNILYAYGPLPRLIAVAEQRGMTSGKVQIPVPHSHSYNAIYDAEEARVLSHWDWKWFPLQPSDED